MKTLILTALLGFGFLMANPILVESVYPMIGVNPEHNFQSEVAAAVNNLAWDFPVTISPWSGPITAHLSGDTVVDLVIFADSSFLYCLRSNGQIYWQEDLSAPVVSFPALKDTAGQVIVSTRDSLISFNLNGSRQWAVGINGGLHPTIWHNTVYVADESGYLSAYDLTNGHLKWQQGPLGGGLENTTATIDSLSGNVYIGTLGNQLQYYDWKVYSFDSLGNQRWVKDYLAFEPGGVQMVMPLISLDKVVHHNFEQFGWTCGVYAVDSSGVIWRYGPPGFQTYYSSIAFDRARNRLYLGTSEGLLVLDTLGNRVNKILTGSVTYSSPLIDSLGNVIIGTDDGKFYIFNPNGQTVFSYTTSDGPLGSLAIGMNGDVYIAGWTKLFCFTAVPAIAEKNKKIVPTVSFRDTRIYNMLGQQVGSSQLRRGIYFVKTGAKTRKVVMVK